MKKYITIVVGLLALLSSVAFAQTATESLVRIQSEVPTGQVTAFFEKSIVVEGVTYRQPWESVSWAGDASKQVTVNGVTMTYGEVMQFVVAIAAQERADQLNPLHPKL